jgi:hypothetical protein
MLRCRFQCLFSMTLLQGGDPGPDGGGVQSVRHHHGRRVPWEVGRRAAARRAQRRRREDHAVNRRAKQITPNATNIDRFLITNT